MTDPIRQLDDESLRILREMVADYKRRRAPERPTKRRYPRGISPNTQYYAYATGGIDPRNDTSKTFSSSSSLTLWKSNSDGTYEETDIETVVYNWSLTAVEDGAFMSVRKESSGIYVVDNADCEAPPEEE